MIASGVGTRTHAVVIMAQQDDGGEMITWCLLISYEGDIIIVTEKDNNSRKQNVPMLFQRAPKQTNNRRNKRDWVVVIQIGHSKRQNARNYCQDCEVLVSFCSQDVWCQLRRVLFRIFHDVMDLTRA